MAKDRLLVQVARSVCKAARHQLVESPDGWLLTVITPRKTHHIVGYDVGLNSSTAGQLASDKSLTFQALEAAGLPAIQHMLFHSPWMRAYVDESGNWPRIRELFERWNNDVVCKPHLGTGGTQVSRARTPAELEEVTQSLFQTNRALTVSPYLKFEIEYRVVVLDDEAKLIFRKDRPAVTGDGRSTVGSLLGSSDNAWQNAITIRTDFSFVPRCGEKVFLEWRHNLAHGAIPVTDVPPGASQAAALAAQAAHKLALRFASVDIAAGTELSVLEVNSGVMLDHFARSSEENRATAERIYLDALNLALG